MRSYLSSTSLFIILCYVVLALVPIQVSYAEELSTAAAQQQETFNLLKSGKKVQQEREYATPDKPTIYLTFDDGPSKLTGKVLDILKKEDIKATFFALGDEAEAHPALVKRIVEEGHTLGNHTYDHVYKDLYSSYDAFWSQLKHSEQIFYEIAGVKPQLVRAPGGTATNFDAFYFYYLDQAGYLIHDWNIDSGDSKRVNVPVEEIVQTVERTPLKHEMTLLFHDGTGHGATVEALPQVIQYFKNKGYTFAPLTSEVKPSQFSVTKLKWNRSMSFSHYQELSGESHDYALAKQVRVKQDDEGQLVHQSKVAAEEAAEALALKNAMPLHVKLGPREWTLEQGEYDWNGQRIEVPLRSLMEQMGGQVAWNDEDKTATAHYGLYDVQYDMAKRSIRVYTMGQKTATYLLADMKLKDGAVRVPLMRAVENIGSQASHFVQAEGFREVTIAYRNGLYWRDNTSILPTTLFALQF
jgi:peptidoglycan/xylan/chitin deacetylase (PgdA/CDA1 family)